MTNRSKNKTRRLKYIIPLFIVGALGTYDEQTIYCAFRSIPREGWKRQNILFFDVAVPDSQTCYKLTIKIRDRDAYSYQNINLSVSHKDPESKRVQVDTPKVVLTNKEGIWKGDDWGGLYQSAFSAGSIKIGKSGNYLFKIAYTLPDEIPPDVNDVGVKLRQ